MNKNSKPKNKNKIKIMIRFVLLWDLKKIKTIIYLKNVNNYTNKIIYNYLQLLCREIIEFLLGSRDQFGEAKLVKGTRGEIKFLISRKSCLTVFSSLE